MRTFRPFLLIKFCLSFLLLISANLLNSCSSDSSGEVGPPLIENPDDFKAVLFVGNSLTNRNSMAEMVRRMAFTTNRALIYTQEAPGGATTADHANSQDLENKIASRQWDFVSIQAQSAELALDDFFVQNNVQPNVMTIVEKILAENENSIPLFYMTYGYRNGDESLCAPLPANCTFEGMNELIKERYLTLNELHNGQLSPCGELWSIIRNRHPELELYEPDGIHPSVLGSYAISLSFYTMIFKADPTQTTYHREELDTDDELLLRELVKEVVFDRISEWQ